MVAPWHFTALAVSHTYRSNSHGYRLDSKRLDRQPLEGGSTADIPKGRRRPIGPSGSGKTKPTHSLRTQSGAGPGGTSMIRMQAISLSYCQRRESEKPLEPELRGLLLVTFWSRPLALGVLRQVLYCPGSLGGQAP